MTHTISFICQPPLTFLTLGFMIHKCLQPSRPQQHLFCLLLSMQKQETLCEHSRDSTNSWCLNIQTPSINGLWIWWKVSLFVPSHLAAPASLTSVLCQWKRLYLLHTVFRRNTSQLESNWRWQNHWIDILLMSWISWESWCGTVSSTSLNRRTRKMNERENLD